MLDKTVKLIGLLLLSALFGGCAKTFKVVAEIPPPLIEPSALVAHVEYSDEFKTYKFLEKADDRSLESVDFGAAQVSLFDRIFASLFNLSKVGQEGHDLKIEPQILDFQYSAPKETKLKLYEVWVKYRVKVSDDNNEQLADWVVKGYGKTPTRMLASHLKAFNTACNVALRDVGAQLAIGFRNQPSIKDYLASKLGGNEATMLADKPSEQESIAQKSLTSDESKPELVPDPSKRGVKDQPTAEQEINAPESELNLELVSIVVSDNADVNNDHQIPGEQQ